jgi:hypothetical protein
MARAVRLRGPARRAQCRTKASQGRQRWFCCQTVSPGLCHWMCPVGPSRACQFCSWTLRWWKGQISSPSSRVVVAPWAQGLRQWWPSQLEPDLADVRHGHQLTEASPRDNVVFEAGLFGGVLGMWRTFILHAEGAKLPTDLLGLTCVRYDPSASATEVRAINQKLRHAIAPRGTDVRHLPARGSRRRHRSRPWGRATAFPAHRRAAAGVARGGELLTAASDRVPVGPSGPILRGPRRAPPRSLRRASMPRRG